METSKRILVVDDEETLCDALGFNLEAEGYEVTTAYSAEEALTHNLSSFDLVMLDIMMGEISGTQLARIMKSNPATARHPHHILYGQRFGRGHDQRPRPWSR